MSLEIPPEGGKRWRFRYRIDGKARMISLGLYPLVSLKEARERAAEAREEVARGLAPSIQGTRGTVFGSVAREWFEWADYLDELREKAKR